MAKRSTASAQLDPMRPWLASLTLSSMALMQSGFDSNAGVETQLQQRLGDQKVRSLESVEEQIGFLADLDEPAPLTGGRQAGRDDVAA